MDKPRGALIAKIVKEGPADKSGLEVGDIITKFGKTDIQRSSDLPPLVGSTPIDKKIPVEVVRNGATRTLSVKIGKLPVEEEAEEILAPEEKSSIEITKLGLTARELSESQSKEFGVENGAVLVEKVENGPAFEAGLRRGDLILKLNNQNVPSLEQIEKISKSLDSGMKVPVLVKRRGGQLFIVINIP